MPQGRRAVDVAREEPDPSEDALPGHREMISTVSPVVAADSERAMSA